MLGVPGAMWDCPRFQVSQVLGTTSLEPGMDAPSRGEGGAPRPAPPHKNDQNRGEVAGQNKGPNLNFSNTENQYDGTILQQWTMPKPASQ